MKWLKIIGFGAIIWVLMFVIISTFVAFKIENNFLVKTILAPLIGGVAAFILAGRLGPNGLGKALTFGILWVIVGLILDYFISRPFAPDIFRSWQLWVGYFLVLIAPVFRIKKSEINSKVILS